MTRIKWSREETIVAFNVYCKIPFKSSSKNSPIVIKYAKILGRSPSALNMKIGNLGRLDPELKKQGVVGLSNGSKMEEAVWNEFHGNWDRLVYESELLISKFQNERNKEVLESDIQDRVGLDEATMVKRRVNQSFFRSAILSSYNSKCCITNLSIRGLLVASHIIPWSIDKMNRVNPRNGLCLNSIHDKAFDKGFMTINADYKVQLSPIIHEMKTEVEINNFFIQYDKRKINLPDRFIPSREFLDYHANEIFIK
jgi:putative restriction endonuclease